MQHYTQAELHFLNILTQEYQLKEISHIGYFRKGVEMIWDDMLNV